MDITYNDRFERRCKMFADGMSSAEVPIVTFQCEEFGRIITRSVINLPGESEYINAWPRSAETWSDLWKSCGPQWYYYDKWHQYAADRLPVGTIVKTVRVTRPKFKSEFSPREERWVPTKSKVERSYWMVMDRTCVSIPPEYMRTFKKGDVWCDLIGTRLIEESSGIQEALVERATIYGKDGRSMTGYRASNKWQSTEKGELVKSLYSHGIRPVDYKGNTIPYGKWQKAMNQVPVAWFQDNKAIIGATEQFDRHDNPKTQELRRALGIETVDQFAASIKARMNQQEVTE